VRFPATAGLAAARSFVHQKKKREPPMKAVIAATFTASLAACYGAAPHRPPQVPLPPPVEGAGIDVFSETKTTFEPVEKQASSCPQGKGEGDPSCVITRYTVTEPITRTTTRASYGAEPITYGQFKVMTDAHYVDKLADLEDLSHKCKRANVPRYIGMGLFAAGLIVGPLAKSSVIAYGGMIGGGVSYSTGYFAFGGRDCVRARMLANEIDMTEAMHWESVEGADYAVEMKTLADQFNRGHMNGPSASADGHRRAADLRMRH
jgi:hypothetical protein